ncbi:MAG: pilus assembly protein TadG-related protein [Planctomycetota bacterium]
MRSVMPRQRGRKGVIVVYAAIMMVVIFGFAAFAIDVGYMALTVDQLQNAADASALAGAMRMRDGAATVRSAARDIASRNFLGKQAISITDSDIELGVYDLGTHAFTVNETAANSVRVTTRVTNKPLFFAPVIGTRTFNSSAKAIAIINPRDIVFCIDLSGSMNDDTEPAWATETIDAAYAGQGYGNVGTTLMNNLYSDLGFGTYPGTSESIGQTLSVANSSASYYNMQIDGGPLTKTSIATTYRISSSDSAATRKTKTYNWIIENQIKRLIPNARPTPSSTDSTSRAYWTTYLDYVIYPYSKSGTAYPPSQDSDRITGLNNPNTANYPNTASTLPDKYQNMIGYRTYVQFLMDFGRERTPTVDNSTNSATSLTKTEISMANTAWCRKVTENTAAGNFSFPPREQPMHAVRRAVIAALKVVEDQNQALAPDWSDFVSIVTFDAIDSYHAPILQQALTKDYRTTMQKAANLQIVADIGSSTATENGIIMARNHLKTVAQGGAGRTYTNKVIILLTDGVPNINSSSNSTVSNYISANPSTNYYSSTSGNLPYNSVLMQSAQSKNTAQIFPIGTGLGADYDFLDRAARLNGTAKNNQAPRGTGNPASYEATLTQIFQDIIKGGRVRLAH